MKLICHGKEDNVMLRIKSIECEYDRIYFRGKGTLERIGGVSDSIVCVSFDRFKTKIAVDGDVSITTANNRCEIYNPTLEVVHQLREYVLR